MSWPDFGQPGPKAFIHPDMEDPIDQGIVHFSKYQKN